MSAIALCNWPVLVDQHCGIMTMLILHSLIGWRLCPVNRYTLGTEGRCRIRSPLAPGRNMLAMTRTRSAYFAPGRLRCALFIVCFCIGPPRKRALRRAIGRAARNPEHTTMYKERPCTLRTLTGRLADPSSRPAPRRRSSQPDCHRGPATQGYDLEYWRALFRMRGLSFKSGYTNRKITMSSFYRRRTGDSATPGASLGTICFTVAPLTTDFRAV